MHNLNELAFEAMPEDVKQIYNGNPFMKLAVDSMSYECYCRICITSSTTTIPSKTFIDIDI